MKLTQVISVCSLPCSAVRQDLSHLGAFQVPLGESGIVASLTPALGAADLHICESLLVINPRAACLDPFIPHGKWSVGKFVVR